jgi:hypothetical protein
MATPSKRPLAWLKTNARVRKSFDTRDLRRLGQSLPGAGPPSREDRFDCLQLALEKLEARPLSEGFPKLAVLVATQKAGNTAIDTLCQGRAQRMTSSPAGSGSRSSPGTPSSHSCARSARSPGATT